MQQVQLLRVALQRKHPCTADHSLHEAIRQAHVPAVRLLLQSRADPNASCLCLERGCEFPLQLAVSCSSYLRPADRFQVVDLLLKAGADPNPRRSDQEGNSPLHDAVRRGDLDVAQLLLRHAADPNSVNGFGETPLQVSLRPFGTEFALTTGGTRAVVEALLYAGANPLGPEGCGLGSVATAELEVRTVLEEWAKWWRCRHLAWAWSRGDHPICGLLPEHLVQVSSFL